MTFVRVVEVTIVQVIGVAGVAHGGVPTARAVLMRMVGMGGGGASRHRIPSFPYSKCTDTAAQRCAATFNIRQLVNRGRSGKGGPLVPVGPLQEGLRTSFPRTRSGLILKSTGWEKVR